MFQSERRGITLVELLVVASVIAIVMGLMLPAIMHAREAARRVSCSSNLRMLGIGLMSYEDAHRALPAASVWRGRGISFAGSGLRFPGTYDYSQGGATWRADGFQSGFFIALLPYLEQQAVYDDFNFKLPLSAPENLRARGTRIPLLMCPSDANTYVPGEFQGGNWARGTYGVNAGPNARCLANPITIPGLGTISLCDYYGMPRAQGVHAAPLNPLQMNQIWGSGIAGVNKYFRLAEITDGTSHTIAVDELRSGISPQDRRGTWALPMIGSSITFGHGKWNYGGIRANVCEARADQLQDCSEILRSVGSLTDRQCMPCTDYGASYMATARSLHATGVHALMLDGSVSHLNYSIDLEPWTAIHTRSGAEINHDIE